MDRFKKGLWLSLMVMGVSGLALTGAFGHPKKATKEMAVEKVEEIKNPDTEFKIELIVDREEYRVGDQVVVGFRTNKDARVTLLNIGSSGQVKILYPNEHHKDNLVKASTMYRLPPEGARFAFKATGPGGQDVIKAIATLDNLPQVTQAETEKDIAVILQDMASHGNLRRWAEADKAIKVVE